MNSLIDNYMEGAITYLIELCVKDNNVTNQFSGPIALRDGSIGDSQTSGQPYRAKKKTLFPQSTDI